METGCLWLNENENVYVSVNRLKSHEQLSGVAGPGVENSPICCPGVIAAQRAKRASSNIVRIKKNIQKGIRILEFITFYQNALHLTRVHCATFYQGALRHEQHEDVTTPHQCVIMHEVDAYKNRF